MILAEQEEIRSAAVDELRHAHKALARKGNLLRTLIDNLPDLVYVKDTKGRFVLGNLAMARLVGHITGATAPDTLVGKTDFDYCPAELAGQYYADEQEIIQSGQPLVNREEPFVDPLTGKRGWVSTTKVPLRDGRGKIIGTVGIGRDITQRKRTEEGLRDYQHRLEKQVTERTVELRNTIEQLQEEIVERQRAEEALQESEEKYRSVVERANDGVAIVQDMIVKYANPRLAEMWGGTAEEVIGNPFTDYVHPDELRRVADRYRRRMADEDVAPIYPTVLRRKDGGGLHVELNAGIIPYEGQPADLAIVRDITERRRAQEALELAAQQWQATFDAINDAVCLLDLEGKALRCNRAVRDLLGKPSSEIVGRTCCQLVHGTPEPLEGCPYLRTKETLRRQSMLLLRGDRWFEVATDPLLDEDGRLIGAVHIMTDITERRRAAEAVERSERLYRGAIEAAGAVPYSQNYSTDRYEFVGPGIEALTGYSPEEFTPEAWEAMVQDVVTLGSLRDLSYDEARRRVRSEEGLPWRAEYLVRTARGEEKWLANSAVHVRDEQGGAVRSIGILQDITERVRAEETLRRSLEQTARSHRLLLALSHAAQAVQRARTPREIYQTVGDEVKRLGYQAVVFTLTEDGIDLTISHLTFEPALVQAVQELTGLSGQDYRFLTPKSVFHHAIVDRQTIFTDRSAEYIADALPGPLRHLSGEIAALLGLEQCIVAPLIVGGQAVGLLSVAGTGLSEADAPAVTAFASQAAIAFENARLLNTVQEHSGELQRLSAQLMSAQEAERRRISRELHDEMGQTLTAMRINLAAVEEELGSECLPTIRERLAETSWLVERTLEQMRELSFDLRPNMLDDLGLVPVLQWYIDKYAKRLSIEVEFKAVNVEERLPAEVETVLYRVVQEALTNVAKHTQASRVGIRLQRTESAVLASVQDNGRGFDVEEIAGREPLERGIGLIGMRERVTALGGRFNIQSRPGQGTQLTMQIPLRSEQTGGPPLKSDV